MNRKINKNILKQSLTAFLFAEPSFISGAAKILDLGSTFTTYNHSFDFIEADKLATLSDWSMVGNDIQNSINDFNNEL